jgi:hypothetical protein
LKPTRPPLSECCDRTSGHLNQVIKIPKINQVERAEENIVELAKCPTMEM